MALAGSVCRTAPSTAHPGGVVAGRQDQHDCESENSIHIESRHLLSKNCATPTGSRSCDIRNVAAPSVRNFLQRRENFL